jgi:hypothetical protein
LTLNPGQLPAGGANQRAGWGDPLVGGRYHYDFGNGWGLTAYGDVGGFDLGAHTDWQVIGTATIPPIRGSTFAWVTAASTLSMSLTAASMWVSTST